MIYYFHHRRIDGTLIETQERGLPDDAAAIEWMGNEVTAQLEELVAYRAGDSAPFARREFGQGVEMLA